MIKVMALARTTVLSVDMKGIFTQDEQQAQDPLHKVATQASH